MTARTAPILIAGAGVAGLTAALAFAKRGFDVQVFERASALSAIGAGVQLSPNATRILHRLGVLVLLEPTVVRPPAIVLRRARDLREIARVPLGERAQNRWGAPYLVVHRADLQTALATAAERTPNIVVRLGVSIANFTADQDGISVALDINGSAQIAHGALLVGADGVWSSLRGSAETSGKSVFAGQIAWRRTIPANRETTERLVPGNSVNAFLLPRSHMIAYPVRAGSEINLVAITVGPKGTEDWAGACDPALLKLALNGADASLQNLAAEAGAWRSYPIHTVRAGHRWVSPGLALIGDAAHAMTPYAAQGAAMAIEDAETLAASLVRAENSTWPAALSAWEAARRPRIDRVRRRAAFNKFAWHASGPVAVARDFVLARRSSETLMADMEWLYGFDADISGGRQL